MSPCFCKHGSKDWSESFITKTRLFKYIENFISKNWTFSDKNSDFQNIDRGYSLEPTLSKNKKNMCNVYPCKPKFYYIKVGFKGVKIILACFRDGFPHTLRKQAYSNILKILPPKNENF